MRIGKLDSKLKVLSKESFIIKQGGKTRLAFFSIFLLLAISAIINFNPEVDFSDERVVATIVIFLLTIISLLISVLIKEFVVDVNSGTIQLRYTILGKLPLYKGSIKKIQSKTIIILKIVFKISQGVMYGNKKDRAIYKAGFETDDKNMIFAESSNPEDINQLCDMVAKLYNFKIDNLTI